MAAVSKQLCVSLFSPSEKKTHLSSSDFLSDHLKHEVQNTYCQQKISGQTCSDWKMLSLTASACQPDDDPWNVKSFMQHFLNNASRYISILCCTSDGSVLGASFTLEWTKTCHPACPCACRWMCIKYVTQFMFFFSFTCNIKGIKGWVMNMALVCTLRVFVTAPRLPPTCTGFSFALGRDIKWLNAAATRLPHASFKWTDDAVWQKSQQGWRSDLQTSLYWYPFARQTAMFTDNL